MLKFFDKRPFMWATHLWNTFDFAADARNQGGEPGMNHKGLVTFDRHVKKDAFYLYKAWWSTEPFVYIAGRRFVDRPNAKSTVTVYSNQPEVTLYINGKKHQTLTGEKVFRFPITVSGEMKIEARAVHSTTRSPSARWRSPILNRSPPAVHRAGSILLRCAWIPLWGRQTFFSTYKGAEAIRFGSGW